MRRKDTGIQVEYQTGIQIGTSGDVTSIPFESRANRSYMIGQNTPGFHRLKRQGKLIPHTPFHQVSWLGEWVQGDNHIKVDSSGDSYRYNPWPGASANIGWRIQDFVDFDCDPTTSPSASDMEYAGYQLQRAASRIYSRGWDALTFAAEAKKTASLVSGFSRRLGKLMISRNPRDAYRLWLEGRYGWRTLAYDVRDIHDAAMNWDAKRKLFTERSGFSATDTSSSEQVNKQTYNLFVGTIMRTYEHQFSIRGAVAGLFSPSRLRTNVVATAWELVPFSFVLDWVYNVGVAIEANAFLLGSREHTASVGYRCDSSVTYEMQVSAKDGYTFLGTDCMYRYTGVRESRSPSKIPSTPQFTGRNLTPELALDMRAISYVRSRM